MSSAPSHVTLQTPSMAQGLAVEPPGPWGPWLAHTLPTWGSSLRQCQSLDVEVSSLVHLFPRDSYCCTTGNTAPENLGQAEISENAPCLFILIFQDFHSSHDDGEQQGRPRSTSISSSWVEQAQGSRVPVEEENWLLE